MEDWRQQEIIEDIMRLSVISKSVCDTCGGYMRGPLADAEKDIIDYYMHMSNSILELISIQIKDAEDKETNKSK